MNDAPYLWDDSHAAALSLRDTGTGVPVITQYGTRGIYLPLFDVGDLVTFAHQMPHGYMEGSSIYPHLHFIPSGGANNNTIKWEITYQFVDNDEAFAAVSQTDTIEVDPTGKKDTTIRQSFLPIVGTGKKISSMLMGSLKRITNGGTDFNGNVFLSFVDIHYKMDWHGSRSELTR